MLSLTKKVSGRGNTVLSSRRARDLGAGLDIMRACKIL